jgi:hypothetical protein
MRRLLALALLLLPATLYAQGAGTPPYRGINNWPLIFGTDNTYDIGASGATRPRTGYFGTSVVTPALTVSGLTSGRVPVAGTGGLLGDDADLTFATDTLFVTKLAAGAGTSSATSLRMTDDNTGFYELSGSPTNWRWASNGADRFTLGSGGRLATLDGIGAGATVSATDVVLTRHAAAVWRCTNSTNLITCLLGGGAAVASASALPVPTGAFYHVTGTTGVTSQTLTGITHGACFTLVFDSTLTVTDGGNLKLNGNLSATADTTLGLCCDATNCYETHRSIN